ncbi:polysaccharide biosynthesis protein, partial [Desulfobacteraceae bacterium SEEP-SAG9]
MPSISLKTLAYACSPSVVHPFLNRIEASDVGSRLARGVFWSTAGVVISRGLMLAASVLVARMLGKTGYGELGMIQS